MGDELFEIRVKAVEKMKAQCDQQFNDLTQLLTRKHLSNRQVTLEMLKIQKCNSDVQNEQIFLSHLEGDKQRAVNLVNERLDQWQTLAAVTLAAVIWASDTYNNIVLETNATKSLGKTALLDVMISFLPELKLLERSFKFLVKDANVFESTREDLKTGIEELKRVSKDFGLGNETELMLLNAIRKSEGAFSKDGARSVKNTNSTNTKSDAAYQLAANAYNAKNTIFQKTIGTLMGKLAKFNNLAAAMNTVIPLIPQPNAQEIVKKMLDDDGMYAQSSIDPSLYEILSNQILYDMLKEYVGKYVVIHIVDGDRVGAGKWDALFIDTRRVGDLPQLRPAGDVNGLEERKDRIYEKFAKVSWSDSSRPPITDYKDLISHWNARIIGFSGTEYFPNKERLH